MIVRSPRVARTAITAVAPTETVLEMTASGTDYGGGMNSCRLPIDTKELRGAGEVEFGVGAYEGRFGRRVFIREVFGQDYRGGGGFDRGGS